MISEELLKVLSPLISALFGGVIVAIVSSYLNRSRTEAEISKAKAETERIRAETEEIRSKQGKQQDEIIALKFLFKCFVTNSELEQLQKLADLLPSTYNYKDEYQGNILVEELRRLRSLDLIRMQPGEYINHILRNRKGDLKQHCEITERGKEYLKLRQELGLPR